MAHGETLLQNVTSGLSPEVTEFERGQRTQDGQDVRRSTLSVSPIPFDTLRRSIPAPGRGTNRSPGFIGLFSEDLDFFDPIEDSVPGDDVPGPSPVTLPGTGAVFDPGGSGSDPPDPAPPNTGNLGPLGAIRNALAFTNPLTIGPALLSAIRNKPNLVGDPFSDPEAPVGATAPVGPGPTGFGPPPGGVSANLGGQSSAGPAAAAGAGPGTGPSGGTPGGGGPPGGEGPGGGPGVGSEGAGPGTGPGGGAPGGSGPPGGEGPGGGPGAGGGAGADGGADKVICTELFRQGLMPLVERQWSYRGTMTLCYPETVRGYHFWAIGVVRAMRRGKWCRFWAFMVRHRACQMGYRMGLRETPDRIGKCVILIFHPVSFVIGMALRLLDHVPDFNSLYTSQYPRI